MTVFQWIEIVLTTILAAAMLFDPDNKRNVFYLLFSVHLSVPIVLIRGAQDSGLFPLDIILLIAGAKLLLARTYSTTAATDWVNRSLLMLAVYFLVIALPCTWLVGNREQFVPAGFWVLRFFLYYLLYLVGRKAAWEGIDHRTLAKINLLAALPLLIIAGIHYSGLADFNYAMAQFKFHDLNRMDELAARLHQGVLGHTRESIGVLFVATFFMTMILFGPRMAVRWKVAAVAVSIVVLVESLFSYSRSSIFAIIAGLLLFAVLIRNFRFLFMILVSLLTIGILLQAVPGLNRRFVLNDNSKYRNVNTFTAGRLSGWGSAIEGFQEDPMGIPFGLGLRSFGEVLKNKKVYMSHGHNIYLQALVELGLSGLILFLLFQYSVVRKIWRQIVRARVRGDRHSLWEAQLCLVLFVSVIISSLSQDNLYPEWGMHAFNVYIYFLIGVVANMGEVGTWKPAEGGA